MCGVDAQDVLRYIHKSPGSSTCQPAVLCFAVEFRICAGHHLSLAEVEQRATSMEEMLVRQMADKQGVTERLKAEDMMAWVRKMNNLRNSAQEIVLAEVVYA